MAVRAKFKVQGVRDEGGEGKKTVILHPVYSDDPASENHEYWQYTPSGQILLTTVNEAAWRQFEPDQEFYVDFTPAA
jgi:hypothetical protein